MDEAERTRIGPDGGTDGIIPGPEGRFPTKSVSAGGHDIQRLHARVPVHRPK